MPPERLLLDFLLPPRPRDELRLLPPLRDAERELDLLAPRDPPFDRDFPPPDRLDLALALLPPRDLLLLFAPPPLRDFAPRDPPLDFLEEENLREEPPLDEPRPAVEPRDFDDDLRPRDEPPLFEDPPREPPLDFLPEERPPDDEPPPPRPEPLPTDLAAMAPITLPTAAPTGPATLPTNAPAAAPAVCLEMDGIGRFSEDCELSPDFWFCSSAITVFVS
ncbi:MAG: hypothetical protein ACJ8KU_11515 [Chthoniobacterales bacterium]